MNEPVRSQSLLFERPFCIGDWRIDPDGLEIRKGDTIVKLEPKVMDLLLFFASQSGHVVSREAILDQVWNGVFVSDDALTTAVQKLRNALGDDPRNPQFIRTISKKGYKFIEKPRREEFKWMNSGALAAFIINRKTTLTAMTAVLAAGLTLALIYFSTFSAPSIEQPYITTITNFSGPEFFPEPSPDGTKIAFSRGDQPVMSSASLYVYHHGAGTVSKLTSHTPGVFDYNPVWATDGAKIAFVRFNTGLGCNIHTIGLEGGEETFITPCGTASGGLFNRILDWSPDGKHLIFLGSDPETGDGTVERYTFETKQTDIIIKPHNQYLYFNPVYSPDSTRIAYTQNTSTGYAVIYIANADGSAARQLTKDYQFIKGLDWAPDGKTIYFSSERKGADAIYRISVESGEEVWFPAAPTGAVTPRIPGSGEYLAFNSAFFARPLRIAPFPLSQDQNPDVSADYLAPYLQDYRSRYVFEVRPSPAGDKIAVRYFDGNIPKFDIVGEDGSVLSLSDQAKASTATNVSWNPAGDKMAFVAGKGERAGIYVLKINDQDAIEVTSSEYPTASPVFSADESKIFYSSYRNRMWQIREIDLETGRERILSRDAGNNLQLAPGADWIYYYMKNPSGQSGIWRISVDGEKREFVHSPSEGFRAPAWQIIGNDIYFLVPETDKGGSQCYRFNLVTKQTVPVHRIPHMIFSFAIVPERHVIYYLSRSGVESDIQTVPLID